MSEDGRLDAVIQAIATEARRRPDFLRALESALEMATSQAQRPRSRPATSRPHRRTPAVVDPFRALREGGKDELRARLADLSLDQLKDVVAQYRVEPYTLAMKWKTAGRLIDLITDTIEQRSRKGDAFRTAEAEAGGMVET